MTLTQVSTWFANARRRLKKENKMTWEPRNKCNSGSGDEEEDSGGGGSSDIEYGENGEGGELSTATLLAEDAKREAKCDSDESKPTNKCDDSDSNASSSQKRNTSSPSTVFENGSYGEFYVWLSSLSVLFKSFKSEVLKLKLPSF